MKLQNAIKDYNDGGIGKTVSPEETFTSALIRIRRMKHPILSSYHRVYHPSGIPQYAFIVNDNFRNYRAHVNNTNGKGHTRAQALASGIMELVERYSCCKHSSFDADNVSKVTAFKDLNDNFFTVDSLLSIISFSEPDPSIVSALENADMAFYKGYTLEGRQTEVPVHFLQFFIGTNGMAAGNTLEEALLHGICEVIERHCLSEISLSRIETPTVAPESIRNPIALDLLDRLRFDNNKLVIKDFSLGLGIPVIGVVRGIDEQYCLVTAGVATTFDEALIRALTESSQIDHIVNYDKIRLSAHHSARSAQISANDIPSLHDDNIKIELERIASTLSAKGMEIVFVETTDKELDLPAVTAYIVNAKRSLPTNEMTARSYILGLIEEQFYLKRFHNAAHYINQGILCSAGDTLYDYYKGLGHVLREDFQKALPCLEAYLATSPADDELHQRCLVHCALCYFVTGETAKFDDVLNSIRCASPTIAFNWHDSYYRIVLPHVMKMRAAIFHKHLKAIRRLYAAGCFSKTTDAINALIHLNAVMGCLYNSDFLLALVSINLGDYRYGCRKILEARKQTQNEPLLENVYSECVRILRVHSNMAEKGRGRISPGFPGQKSLDLCSI
jgi:ribosomal protein S12 methylthiotransferase accessory factor